MAIEFASQRTASEGPLDVAHNGGASDNAPFTLTAGRDAGDANDTLDGGTNADAPLADDEELLRQKNPLGYTVTEPTEAEMDAATKK